MARDRKGGKILTIKEVDEKEILGSSLMLFGESYKDPIFSKLLSKLPSPVRFQDGTFSLKGKKISEEDESLLFTYPHPLSPEKWITLYLGLSPISLSRARFIFFYGWDSYIVFKSGRPIERGNLPPKASFVSYDLLRRSLNRIETQKLKDHIAYLSSPEMEGRFPGTSGYRKTQAYLINQVKDLGITPIYQPFSIFVKDIGETSLIITTSKKEEKLWAIPPYFSKGGEWKGAGIFCDEKEIDEVKNVTGKAILVINFKIAEGEEDSLFRKMGTLQSRGASAILFFIQEEDLNHLSPYITYPSYFPPAVEERLKKREKEGYGINRWIEASKVVARGKEIDFSVQIPILFVPYPKSEEWVKNFLEEKEAFVQFTVQSKETQFQDLNIGGILEGEVPGKKDEFLVLGAHYDHLGQDEKSGFYYPGADDNGSGVAAILEMTRILGENKKDLRRNLLFLFFGGEEWGLWGSRTFIQRPFVPLQQVKAMLSLDSIGGKTEEKEVSLIGRSFYPSLAERNKRFIHRLGLKEGQDIDRYAFVFGSDHYPFSQAGIPSLDYFASDYKKLHTLQDRLESIDLEKLSEITRLIYLTVYEFLTEP